jgi:hypothetical protein
LPVKLQADGNALFNTFQQFAGAAGTAICSTIVVASNSGQINGFHHGLIFISSIVLLDLMIIWQVFRRSN